MSVVRWFLTDPNALYDIIGYGLVVFAAYCGYHAMRESVR